MIQRILFFSALLFMAASTYAQDNLTGRIYEYKTNNIIPGTSVRNLRTNYTTVSDRTGAYSIPAKVGDLILFMSFAYQPDTLYVKDLKYTDVQLLLKGHTLDEVKVTGQETRLGNLKPAPTLAPFGGQTLVYNTDTAGNYTGGVRLNMFDSHDAASKRKRDAKTEKDEAMKAHIGEIFSLDGLKNYLPIKGQELGNFIVLYTPDIETFTDPNFNLTLYINTCYKEFLKISAEKRQSKEFLQLLNKTN